MFSDSDIQSLIIFKLAVLVLRAGTVELTVYESAVDELAVYPVSVFGIGIHKNAVDKPAVQNYISIFMVFVFTVIESWFAVKTKAEELSIFKHSVHDTSMLYYHSLKLHIYDIEID